LRRRRHRRRVVLLLHARLVQRRSLLRLRLHLMRPRRLFLWCRFFFLLLFVKGVLSCACDVNNKRTLSRSHLYALDERVNGVLMARSDDALHEDALREPRSQRQLDDERRRSRRSWVCSHVCRKWRFAVRCVSAWKLLVV
jgi:hypothetical protein